MPVVTTAATLTSVPRHVRQRGHGSPHEVQAVELTDVDARARVAFEMAVLAVKEPPLSNVCGMCHAIVTDWGTERPRTNLNLTIHTWRCAPVDEPGAGEIFLSMAKRLLLR